MKDFSRRTLITGLGGTVALIPFTGAPINTAESLKLPQGLYEPSLEHLAHALKETAEPIAIPEPRYFSGQDLILVRTLTGLILGVDPAFPPVPEIVSWIDRTVDNAAVVRATALDLLPAYRRVAIEYYGEEEVKKLETEDVQAICRNGLAEFRQSGFGVMEQDAQISHLEILENAGDSFISWFKRHVLEGFYTSKEGLKELDYKGNSFHSQCPGCEHP